MTPVVPHGLGRAQGDDRTRRDGPCVARVGEDRGGRDGGGYNPGVIEAETRIDQAPGTFLGNVNTVLVTYALDGALAFLAGVLIARALGPDGRGAYALFVLSTAVGQMVLGLGFGNAAVYYINRREMSVRDATSAAHSITAGALLVTAAIVGAVIAAGGGGAVGAGVHAWLLIAAVPLLVYAAAMRMVLQAQSRFVAMGMATIAQPVMMLALVVPAYAAGAATPSRVAAMWIASNAVAATVALGAIGAGNIDLSGIVRPRLNALRRLASFGLQGEAGNILQLANYRLDQYIVKAFVGLAGVGIYAVGVSMTEAVWLIANAVAIVLVPRLTSAHEDDVRWIAPVATRNTLLIAGLASLALAAVAPVLLPLFFGRDYEDAVRALWLLLPGTVALTGSKVLTGYIFSQGRPLVNTMITLVSLAVTTAALLALVPAFGVNGAAAASSLAYFAHFAAALYAYRRISGAPVSEVVLPHPSDARLYRDAFGGAIRRLRAGRGVDAPQQAG